ncbi:MAG: flagellar hook-associated protein FlgK [Acidobacteriaceae bacterium]|jgi:flagellar hook-associated protein 1 FlgK
MASLSSSLSTAVQSLIADTGALQITNNNIANANTPGYSRQVPVFQEAPPTEDGNLTIGNGVVLQGYQSVRDELVSNQIQQETQAQSSANAQLGSLQQIQPAFTTSTQDIGTEMSALFASISALSTNPTSSSEREGVLAAGQNLAAAFNSTSNVLTAQQTALNTPVTNDVGEINQLTQQIAALNPQIAELQANGQDGGSLQDQQTQLVLKLSSLTNVSVTQTPDGETLTTGSGTPLVVGSQSYALQTTTGSDGMQHVLDQNGTDITASITSGDLGGTIQTRDQTIPGLLSQLDTLANQFGTAFNAAQAKGFNQNGAKGTNFFNLPATVAGSAASISLALTSPTQVAASSDGTAGSNGNLANLSAVQTTPLSAGNTPADLYASLVYQVGSLTSNANAESTATAASLLQLNDQLSSVSGVSIDEETTNLITFQTAYEAAARVVSTLQGLFTTTLAMGTAAAE